MSKLCCFPLSETPEVNVKMNCVSTCCASELRDNVRGDILDSVHDIKDGIEHDSVSCCCKKKKSSKVKQRGGETKIKDKDE